MVDVPSPPPPDPAVKAQKEAADAQRIEAIKQSLGSDTASLMRLFGSGSLAAAGAAPPYSGGGFSSNSGSYEGLAGLVAGARIGPSGVAGNTGQGFSLADWGRS